MDRHTLRLNSGLGLIGLLAAISACSATDSSGTGDSGSSSSTDLPTLPLTTDCRPVDHVWDPNTEPLLLPCEPTVEPCDGLDNDNDGFTDPHCPTMPCNFDSECTYGGLLPDADCNIHIQVDNGTVYEGGVCNQIDGVPGAFDHTYCWGKLCPPTKKCVQGECVTPGTGLPGSPCTNGADCPLNSGCIPGDGKARPDKSAGTCYVFCHDVPCPKGFSCEKHPHYETKTDSFHMSQICAHDCPEDCETDCDVFTGECLASDPWESACEDDCKYGCGLITNICVSTLEQGKCISQKEAPAMKNQVFDELAAYACVLQLPGAVKSISKCIDQFNELNAECNQCWSSYMECVADKCSPQCSPKDVSKCLECGHLACGAAFTECSGWVFTDN